MLRADWPGPSNLAVQDEALQSRYMTSPVAISIASLRLDLAPSVTASPHDDYRPPAALPQHPRIL